MSFDAKKQAFSSKNSSTKLRRPYLRKETREQIQANAPKNEKNQFMYKGKVIEGKWDYGHVYGKENWAEIQKAEIKGKTQAEFNDYINSHPEFFEIQPHDVNISHAEEMSKKEHEKVINKMKKRHGQSRSR